MKRIALVKGHLRRDKFFFPCRVNGRRIANVVLDTGAFDFVISNPIAQELKLPRGKTIIVRGVSGRATAWTSSCSLTVGGRTFQGVPCVIMKDLPYDALFGLRFFVDNGYQLLLDPKAETLSVLR